MCDFEKKSISEKQCYDDSHTWHIVDGVDLTIVNSISVGKIVQLQVFEKLFENSQINSDRRDIKSILKKLNLEWMVRAFASLFDDVRDDKQADILFMYDVNNEPMIQALNILGDTLQARGCSVAAVVVDKVISKKCKLERKVSWFKSFSFIEIFKVVGSVLRLRKTGIKKSSKCFSYLTSIYGVKKSCKIYQYYKWQMPQVLIEIRALLALLQSKKPSVVVLASDAHRVSRMFVFLCKTIRIKTVVYQHGATIWEYGYVPVYADCMLVWGSASRQWFIERGVDGKRLIEVGNIRSDELGYRSIVESDFTPVRKVYFFPNPIDRKITEDVISMFLKICNRYNLEGVVKLHPSEKNIDFFKSRISTTKCKISISTDPIIKARVNPGDIAIVVNSTAGVDFCLEGGYVLNVEVDSMPNPIDYEGFGVGVKTSLSLSFFDDYERLVALPIKQFLINREKFIHSYLGVLDGDAKNRACNVIVNLIESDGERH